MSIVAILWFTNWNFVLTLFYLNVSDVDQAILQKRINQALKSGKVVSFNIWYGSICLINNLKGKKAKNLLKDAVSLSLIQVKGMQNVIY